MKAFKRSDKHMGTVIQFSALMSMLLGMLLAHWLFVEIVIGLITGFFLFAILLVAHLHGRVTP